MGLGKCGFDRRTVLITQHVSKSILSKVLFGVFWSMKNMECLKGVLWFQLFPEINTGTICKT
jgi:hypothetical protein